MIYVDTSVVLALLLSEVRQPPASFWTADLVTSRLTEYETWVRLHAYGHAQARGPAANDLFAELVLLELDEAACSRCRTPFPTPVRTLDALHLSAVDTLHRSGQLALVATYDARMREAAVAMGFPLFPL